MARIANLLRTQSLKSEDRINSASVFNLSLSQLEIIFAINYKMTQRMHFKVSSKIVRDSLDSAVNLADEIHAKESELISFLSKIDQDRFYVRYGYKSLLGFCRHGLKFTKTQSQRLATEVRRIEPMDNIRRKEESLEGAVVKKLSNEDSEFD